MVVLLPVKNLSSHVYLCLVMQWRPGLRRSATSNTSFISSSHSHLQDVSKNPSLLSEMSAPPKGSDKRDRKRNARQAERKTTEIKYLDVPQVNCYGYNIQNLLYHHFCKDRKFLRGEITRLSR